MRKLSRKQQEELLNDMLDQYERKEYGFAIIDENGTIQAPVQSANGIVKSHEPVARYRGIALEINERGNTTVWDCFKNGNKREITSCV